MDKKLNDVMTNVEVLKGAQEGETLYSSKVKKGSEETLITAKLTKQIAAQQKALKVEETEERNKKTILIRKPMDTTINNSKSLR